MNLTYTGKVTIYTPDNKNYTTIYNNGSKELFNLIINFLVGSTISSDKLPCKLGVFKASELNDLLNNPSISTHSSSSCSNYYTRYNTIEFPPNEDGSCKFSFLMESSSIMQDEDPNKFLCLINDEEDPKILAAIAFDDSHYDDLILGSSLIIEWTLRISN